MEQVPDEEKPPPPTEPEKAEEPKSKTPALESGSGGKLKLSLDPKKVEPPKQKEEKNEEEALPADPFDIKPKPIEDAPPAKLSIKPKAPPAEEKPKPATPPPPRARKKKRSGISIRGLSTQPFEAKDTSGTEINKPETPVADKPVVKSKPSPTVEKAPPPVIKAPPPPPVKKKPVPAPPPPGKKKPVPAPPPKVKVKLSKPAEPEGKKEMAPPPPPPASDKKKKAESKKVPKKPGAAKASPKKMILAVLFVGLFFLAAAYFLVIPFISSPDEETWPQEPVATAPDADNTPPPTAPDPQPQPQTETQPMQAETETDAEVEASEMEMVEFTLPAPQPSTVDDSDIVEAESKAPIFQFEVQETVEDSEPLIVETETETVSEPEIYQPPAPEQDPEIIAFIESLVYKSARGDGSTARILLGEYQYDAGDFVEESLGVRFSGINNSTRQILFTDSEGAVYYKPF